MEQEKQQDKKPEMEDSDILAELKRSSLEAVKPLEEEKPEEKPAQSGFASGGKEEEKK